MYDVVFFDTRDVLGAVVAYEKWLKGKGKSIEVVQVSLAVQSGDHAVILVTYRSIEPS